MIKIDWIEKKSDTWKVATITENGKQMEGVSINRHDTKGRVFPNFDSLAAGQEIEATLYISKTTGKAALYPPQENKSQGGAFRGVKPDMTALMDKKQDGIKELQGNKDMSIKISSTMRDAVICAIAEFTAITEAGLEPVSLGDLIKKWREILWKEFDNYKDFSPF